MNISESSPPYDPDQLLFSRTGSSALGKCTAVLKTNLPDELDTEFRQMAQKLGCSPSELMRDLVCLALRDCTFGELTSAERRKALRCEGPEKGLLSHLFNTSQGA